MSSDSKEHPTISPDHQLPAPTSEQHQHHKTVRIIVWVVILLIFGIGFFLILHHHDDTAKKPSRHGAGGTATITTATAQKGDIGIYLDAIGTVTPIHTASITSQVNGVVTSVHYQEGQIVRQGAPLVDIDSRPYRATLLQAQGILERDENILAQAKMDLIRYQDAWSRNAIPKQTLDDQEKIVLQDEGTVKNDQGTVQYDQVQVDYCHITAPFTGRIGLRLVDPGNVVQSSGGTTLAVITQIQPITAIFTIAEDNLGQVQPRLRAKLPVYAFDRTSLNKIATGSLLTLDNLIDTTTGTVKARALFDNKNGVLFPNEFINTRLLVNTLHNVTLVPSSTVQHNGQESFVYIVQNNVAHVRSVKPGVTDDNTTQIEGVNPGDVLADSSFEKLQDNSKIIISKTPVPTSTTGSEAP
ncbi:MULTISPECIES: efflux RND transporter periplasmic adaptor subunit [Acidobacteriaceae]|uniref:efflux RND transporter periplasmic adaptor subunit n=1 Tax=Acidobacteriaceae TaxID=204434 RepID=UPI00131D454E|nr:MULTISPECIES: efflux RND transporter periplasmic adaptor subunit [Acidobacteriaceae]MDW5267640.1 efflux RND transporter periplasmic adaptor subunit [Edaphobacter sp.]